MSYRKIMVKEKEYQHTTGKTHTKVKGVGVWPNHEVGSEHPTDCGCGFVLADCPNPNAVLRVTPVNIAEMIKKNV